MTIKISLLGTRIEHYLFISFSYFYIFQLFNQIYIWALYSSKCWVVLSTAIISLDLNFYS